MTLGDAFQTPVMVQLFHTICNDAITNEEVVLRSQGERSERHTVSTSMPLRLPNQRNQDHFSALDPQVCRFYFLSPHEKSFKQRLVGRIFGEDSGRKKPWAEGWGRKVEDSSHDPDDLVQNPNWAETGKVLAKRGVGKKGCSGRSAGKGAVPPFPSKSVPLASTPASTSPDVA